MKYKDWMPSTRAGKNAMFTNFLAKIDGYQATLSLTDEELGKLRTICNSYTLIYDKTEQIRATNQDLTSWQDAMFSGKPRGSAAPASPVFTTITLPSDAFIGILDEFRELVGFIKNNPAYTENIGIDLMIVAGDEDPDWLADAHPELKLATKNDTQVEVNFIKGDASSVEIQYRTVGMQTWNFADKSTTSPVVVSPQFPTPGQPEKFEYRGVYLVKNERVGNWSPIYSITVG